MTQTDPQLDAEFDAIDPEEEGWEDWEEPEEEENSDPDPTAGMDDLESLLAGAVRERDTKLTVRSLRKAAKDFQSSPEARKRAEEALKEWESKLEWNSVCNVALFHDQTCSCCKLTHRSFGGFLLFQTHRHTAHQRRWVSISQPDPALHREVAFQYGHTPVCHVCAGGSGWDFSRINPFTLPERKS